MLKTFFDVSRYIRAVLLHMEDLVLLRGFLRKDGQAIRVIHLHFHHARKFHIRFDNHRKLDETHYLTQQTSVCAFVSAIVLFVVSV
jgi:hypothetical protein